jgi:branched-chain amino acid transport system substrate-binding protein
MQLPGHARNRWRATRFAVAAVAVAGAAVALSAAATNSPAATNGPANATHVYSLAAAATAAGPTSESQISNLVAYVHGKAGHADMSLKPIDIGYVNNQGGSIVGYPESTLGTQMAVDWINQHTTGIDGHPLKLVTCFVKNAEAEGLACAEQFLADKNMPVIMYGAVFVGGATINSTVAGKKPIIEPFAQNAVDISAKDNFQLFTAPPFDFYGWGTAGKFIEHAKTAAVLYSEGTGLNLYAGFAAQALRAEGITTKVVGFPSSSTDLEGALVSAGAQSADIIAPMISTAGNCASMEAGLTALNIDPAKVIGIFPCASAAVKNAYPTHDYPHWWYGIAQSGDALVNTPTGIAYRKILDEYHYQSYVTSSLFPGMVGTIFTIAQFMNNVGYAKVTPQSMIQQVKVFKGPLFMGEPTVRCGNYASGPGNCGGGDHFFRYLGNGKWSEFPYWLNVPIALQKKYHAKSLLPLEQSTK